MTLMTPNAVPTSDIKQNHFVKKQVQEHHSIDLKQHLLSSFVSGIFKQMKLHVGTRLYVVSGKTCVPFYQSAPEQVHSIQLNTTNYEMARSQLFPLLKWGLDPKTV